MAQAKAKANRKVVKPAAHKGGQKQLQDAVMPTTQGQAATSQVLVMLSPLSNYQPKKGTALNNQQSFANLQHILANGPVPMAYLYGMLHYLPTQLPPGQGVSNQPHGKYATYMARQKPPLLVVAPQDAVSVAPPSHLAKPVPLA